MAKNRLQQLRKSRGLTQRALAELAGTSQQQIQRVEAGTQGIRLELATSIASALNCALSEIFPSLGILRTRKKSKSGQGEQPAPDERFLEAGIDADPAFWTVKFFAHDGRVFLYSVPSDEKARLEQIASDGDDGFVVFTTDTHRVALNLKRIAATQFLFDFGVVRTTKEPSEKLVLNLHLIAAKDTISFDVEPDEKPLEEDDEGVSSQLQNMFFYLDLGLEEREIVCFDDIDGERVYIRPTEILAIEVPLTCCEPALWKAEFEGYLEDEGTTKTNSGPEKVTE